MNTDAKEQPIYIYNQFDPEGRIIPFSGYEEMAAYQRWVLAEARRVAHSDVDRHFDQLAQRREAELAEIQKDMLVSDGLLTH